MTTENPNAIAIESFVPIGRPPDGVAGVISLLGISGLGAGYDISGGSQMDKMEVEANPPGVGDAPALVDVVNGESIPKPSFRDIVGGGIVADQRNNIIDSLDVSLTEEDVRVSHTGVYLEIRFFERVHQEIDAKLSKSVIVRLLDLDNDYYLIQFARDVDYDKVLSDGPWMIYGCYLTMPLIPGIVIDGLFQAIKYEGLPVICFGCGKYGHSKEVCGQTEVVTVPPAPGRSRFKELELLGEDNQRNASGMEQDSGRESNTQGMGTAVRVSNVVGEAEGSAQAVVKGVVHSTSGLREVVQVNPVMVDEGCDGSGDGHVEQPCQEEVVVSPRVDAKGVKRSSLASKAFPRKDLRSKKKNELGSAQLVVEDWVSKFASSLNMGTMVVSSSVVNDVNNVVVGDANYEPRDENVSIEAKPLLTSSHVSDVLAIMEPHVSGLTVENFIWRAGFDYSYRVEANGFSFGIWVMWKNTVNIDVAAVVNQFIHGSCFVVASQQRSALWGLLRAFDPGLAHPWILGCDFNVICSSAERHGGSVRRSGRGDLSQRLDRCLCNGKWYEMFALSDVLNLPRLGSDHRLPLLTTTPAVHNGGRGPFRFLSIWNDHPDFDRRKARVLARIKGVELALDRDESPFLLELESNLKKELSEISGARGRVMAEFDKIAGVAPPHASYGGDKLGWRWEENRLFSTSSTYRSITRDGSSSSNGLWNVAWRINVPRRVRVFFWLLLHNKLLTKVERNHRHLTDVATCSVCGQGDAAVDHVLRGCGCARQIWTNLVMNDRLQSFLSMPFTEWITVNIQDIGNMVSLKPVWPSLFSITCWVLWKKRCCLVLGSDPNCYGDVISFCQRFRDEVVAASTRHASNVQPRTGMCWLPPPRGWVKVNADGAVGDSPVMEASGGVICDEASEWLLGFAHNIRSCSILCSKLWAAFDSLSLAWRRGFRKVILELDNMQAVLILNGESSAPGDNLLVVRIKELLVKQWDVRVRHIVREANKVDDGLAWLVRGEPIGEWFYDIPPLEVSGWVVNDREVFCPKFLLVLLM
ncbi:hypothetical protein GQ457_04G024310 [Hibiscus cannabinus]